MPEDCLSLLLQVTRRRRSSQPLLPQEDTSEDTDSQAGDQGGTPPPADNRENFQELRVLEQKVQLELARGMRAETGGREATTKGPSHEEFVGLLAGRLRQAMTAMTAGIAATAMGRSQEDVVEDGGLGVLAARLRQEAGALCRGQVVVMVEECRDTVTIYFE